MDYTPTQATENSKDTFIDPGLLALSIAFSILLLIVFSIVTVKLLHPSHPTITPLATQTSSILDKLDEIETQLQQLRDKPQLTNTQQVLNNTLQNLTSLQQAILILANKDDVKTLSTQLSTVKVDVDNQMGELKTLITENAQHQKIISRHELPFDCFSVDVIAGHPLLSVNYQHLILPLLVGDTLAGWQVMQASLDNQQIEFRDPHGELVIVKLNP